MKKEIKEKRNLNFTKKQGLIFFYCTCSKCKNKDTYASSAKMIAGILKKNNAFHYPNTKEQNDIEIKKYNMMKKDKALKEKYSI